MAVKEILIVVDSQYDFIDGSLGTPEAVETVPKIAEKINGFNGTIIATQDSHDKNYLNTREGKMLPVVHTVVGTHGWDIHKDISTVLKSKGSGVPVQKYTFASPTLRHRVAELSHMAGGEDLRITIIGFCTDICVISIALDLRSSLSEAEIIVDADCCAGVTPELHQEALHVMQSCHIKVA